MTRILLRVLFVTSSDALIAQSGLIYAIIICVRHSLTYISFVREYVVQFRAEDFHCENVYKEEIV
jgi:hypothetical protein